MATVDVIDYLRAHALERRTIKVDVPSELVAKKGTTQPGRARCRRAEVALRASIGAAFRASGRRQYRSDIAAHLTIGGLKDIGSPEASRTVKALVDAMKGPVVADDRAVGLLEVSSMAGPLAAQIAVCSVSEYADAYDVLSGVSDDQEEDDFLPFHDRPSPWSWNQGILAGDDLDQAREALHDFQTYDFIPADTLTGLWDHYARRVADLEKQTFTSTPYSSTDRPGKPNLAARIWDASGIWGGANCLRIPAPLGGDGSWTELATAEWTAYIQRWRQVHRYLQRDDFALDIAVGTAADDVGFDVDNLAARVLRGMRRAIPEMVPLDSYRVYRRFADEGSVVLRLHHPQRALELRMAMTGSPLALMDLRPDSDARVHRRQASDVRLAEEFRALSKRFDAA